MLGASGYTGEEVVRLLALHPNFKVAALTGETQAGKVMPIACIVLILILNLSFVFWACCTDHFSGSRE